jgi:ATP-dependent DNA ligase
VTAFQDLVDGGSKYGKCSWVQQVEPTMEWYDYFIKRGYEGAIVKDVTKPYGSGKRGHGWFKLKETHTVEVVVVGSIPGKGKFTGQIGALVFAQNAPRGELSAFKAKDVLYPYSNRYPYIVRGSCSGMTDAQREEFTNDANLVGTVIEIAHMGADLTAESYKFRHPQFKRVRDDKRPRDVGWHDR